MGFIGVKKVTGGHNGGQGGEKSPRVTQWGSVGSKKSPGATMVFSGVTKVPGGHNGGQGE